MVTCTSDVNGRRRLFWAHAPCKSTPVGCGLSCSTFGVQLDNGGPKMDHDTWIRGLATNMLLTDGVVPASQCGVKPGQRGGHWSDSYRSSEYAGSSGSMLRTLGSFARVGDAKRLIQTYAEMDLQKLVQYGIATSVKVTVEYVGGNVFKLDCQIFGKNGEATNVSLTGSRPANSWVWNQ